MPARGLGWPGSVFTVGTCRGLLLALLLELSMVTTVSDIMLRRLSRVFHLPFISINNAPCNRTPCKRKVPFDRTTRKDSREGSKIEGSKKKKKRKGKQNIIENWYVPKVERTNTCWFKYGLYGGLTVSTLPDVINDRTAIPPPMFLSHPHSSNFLLPPYRFITLNRTYMRDS